MITPIHSWYPPPKLIVLGKDEVHIWRASLDLPASGIWSLQQTLSADERKRAKRLYFQRDQEHFIVARGLLRAILGRYLNMQPGQLRFCYNPNGKPSLDRAYGGDVLRFNLSHSHGLALYAVTHGREIGIDLERIRPEVTEQQTAERFFSPQEVAVLNTLPANIRTEAFFNCWTRKEAYIKARGEGLSAPLDNFEVSLAPGEVAALLSFKGDPQETSRWSLQELYPGPGYVAAIAVEGSHRRLKCWQWPD